MKQGAEKRLSRKMMRPPAETRRVTVGFRVSESVRERLAWEANRNARSLSQEAETRLEASLNMEEMVRQTLALAYGEEVARGMFTFGDTIRTIHVMRNLAGVSDANRAAIIKGCTAGLTGLVDNLINAGEKK